MPRRFLILSALAFALGAISTSPSSLIAMTPQSPSASAAHENPLLKPSPLPFGAPPFDKIQDADFKPAIEAGIKAAARRGRGDRRQAPRAPTFENTLVALEKSGAAAHARRASSSTRLASANTNPTLQTLQEERRAEARGASTTRSS